MAKENVDRTSFDSKQVMDIEVNYSHTCTECSYSTNLEDKLTKHMKTHSRKRSNHECKICGKFFPARASLNTHQRIHTGERLFSCSTCGKEFVYKNVWKSHEKRCAVERERKFSCDQCSFFAPTENRLKRHMRSHSEASHNCTECSYSTNCKENLSKHMRTHSRKRTNLECKKCGRSFSTAASLNVHQRIHAGERPFFSCSTCGKKFAYKYNMKTHEKGHAVEREPKFSCNQCNYNTHLKKRLISHLQSHSGEKPFQCEICSKSYKTKAHLLVHLRVHTGEKPFSCNVCGEKFRHSSICREHERYCVSNDGDTLKRELSFRCNQCSFVTHVKYFFDCHLRTHSGATPFECDICHRSFRKKAVLREHKLTHSEERPFQCSICGMTFKRLRNCRGHQKRRHALKENPYSESTPCSQNLPLKEETSPNHEQDFCCNHCSYVTNVKYSFDCHMRTHLEARPYVCEICHTSFRRKFALKEHKVTHSEERPFSCSICGKTFKLFRNCRGHQIRCHGLKENPHSESIPCSRKLAQKEVTSPSQEQRHGILHPMQDKFLEV